MLFFLQWFTECQREKEKTKKKWTKFFGLNFISAFQHTERHGRWHKLNKCTYVCICAGKKVDKICLSIVWRKALYWDFCAPLTHTYTHKPKYKLHATTKVCWTKQKVLFLAFNSRRAFVSVQCSLCYVLQRIQQQNSTLSVVFGVFFLHSFKCCRKIGSRRMNEMGTVILPVSRS